MADDDAGTSAVRCRIGGHTSTVDSAQTCADLGGTVVQPPPKRDGTRCREIGPTAGGFGFVDYDIVPIAETFMDEVLKKSEPGKRFLKALISIDRFVMDAVRRNPSLMGEVVLAWTTCIAFLGARDSKKAKFSVSTYRRLGRLERRLRKSSKDARFHRELDFLKAEFKSWVNRSPAEIREKYLEIESK